MPDVLIQLCRSHASPKAHTLGLCIQEHEFGSKLPQAKRSRNQRTNIGCGEEARERDIYIERESIYESTADGPIHTHRCMFCYAR